jgi:hypothetical protein
MCMRGTKPHVHHIYAPSFPHSYHLPFTTQPKDGKNMHLSYERCCDLLHLDPTKPQAHTQARVRQSYLQQARKYHPDKCPGNRDATRKFQEISCAYDTLIRHAHDKRNGGVGDDTSSTDSDTDLDTDIDVELYKELFEKLSAQASVFWETSAEVKLFRTLWTTWKNRPSEDQERETCGCATKGDAGGNGETRRAPCGAANGGPMADGFSEDDADADADADDPQDGSEYDSCGSTIFPPTPSTTPHATTPQHSASDTGSDTGSDNGSDEHDASAEVAATATGPNTKPVEATSLPEPICITLKLPLQDVYHNTLHRVRYTRYTAPPSTMLSNKGDGRGGHVKHVEEEKCVLVPAGCREFRCCREGDQVEPGGERGDVIFRIEVTMPDTEHRVHPSRRVLQRLVWLSPEDVCYGVVASDERHVVVCGQTIPLVLPQGLYRHWQPRTSPSQLQADTGLSLFDSGHVIDVPDAGFIIPSSDTGASTTDRTTICASSGAWATDTARSTSPLQPSSPSASLSRDVMELVCVVRERGAGTAC